MNGKQNEMQLFTNSIFGNVRATLIDGKVWFMGRDVVEDLGYKKGYRYAHDYPGAYAAGESFFPEELTGTVYYHPSDRGLEANLGKKEDYLKERDDLEEDKRYPKGYIGKRVKFR